MTPERLWLLAIGLRRSGHPRLAKLVKQVNSAIYHDSLATGAEVAPDIYLGHHGLGTVINDRSPFATESRCGTTSRSPSVRRSCPITASSLSQAS